MTMPEPQLYIAFVLVATGIIVMPGPNVLLIMATALAHGRRRGLQAVAGTAAAMLLQLVAAGALAASLAVLLAETFSLLKWLGVAYLAWLGLRHLRAAIAPQQVAQPAISGHGTFWRGFAVSLTNPKTVMFFGAFLPQFVDPGQAAVPQLVLLSATFWLLAIVLDSCWVFGSNALRRSLSTPRFARCRDGGIGTLYLGAGLGLALLRRG